MVTQPLTPMLTKPERLDDAVGVRTSDGMSETPFFDMTTVHVARMTNEEPFHYLDRLSFASWHLLAYLRDETLARRPALWWSSESQASPTSSPKTFPALETAPPTEDEKDAFALRGTIPKSQLEDFTATFRAFEGFALLGLILCFQAMLYDVTVMPLKALFTGGRLVRAMVVACFHSYRPSNIKWRLRIAIQSVSDKLLSWISFWRHPLSQHGLPRPRYFSRETLASPCVKSEPLSSVRSSKQNLSKENAGGSLKVDMEAAPRNQIVSSNDLTSLLDCSVLLCVFLFYRGCFQASSMYHFIRGQSLLKLYVVFNMLEIVERMWRSSERDVLDDLRLQADALIFGGPSSVLPTLSSPSMSPIPSDGSPHVADSETYPFLWRWPKHGARRLTSLSSMSCLSGTDAEGDSGFSWRIAVQSVWCNPWIRLFRRFLLAVVYVIVHTAMHLGRGMLLCIAMNAPESAMFLLLVTNNFGEIKSTVFKKQTPQTLWILAASDVCERFQIFTDILFVYLQTSRSPRAGASAASNAFKWLGMMLAIEVFVDYSKHAFLVKFNKLRSNLFTKFRTVCMMDVLISRSPTAPLDLSFRRIKVPTPGQGMMSFVHISTRRLGFNTLPFLAFLICFAPSPLISFSPLELIATAACGVTLYILLMVINMSVLKFCIDRASEIEQVNDEFAKLAPQ